jgi:hypothetical protein
VGAHVVLRVAHVDEGKRLGLRRGRVGVDPLAPVGTVPHTVGIQRIGGQALEGDGVILGRHVGLVDLVGGECCRLGGDRAGFRVEGGRGAGRRDLCLRVGPRGGGPPGHAERGGRVLGPIEDDPVRVGAGRRRGQIGVRVVGGLAVGMGGACLSPGSPRRGIVARRQDEAHRDEKSGEYSEEWGGSMHWGLGSEQKKHDHAPFSSYSS